MASDDLLDVVELVERFHGCEVVDVQSEDLIANLRENGIIKLEDAQLGAFSLLYMLHVGLADRSHFRVVGLQLVEDDVGTLDDGAGHACDFRYMDTEGVL